MSNFKLTTKPAKLKNDVSRIDYDKTNNNGYLLAQLENLIANINKSGAPKGPTQQMLILGAILVTQKLIANPYHLRSANNSRLHKALGKITLVQELNGADDSELAKSFALRAVYQWYQGKTFYNSQRILGENVLSKNEDTYTGFEELLGKLAEDLPEITSSQYKSFAYDTEIADTGYSLETQDTKLEVDSSESSRTITNILTFGFFGNSSTPATAEVDAKDTKAETPTAQNAL